MAFCVSPEGAAQVSPGREPWVLISQEAFSPEGATQRYRCIAPSGLRFFAGPVTQGSRPGLSCAAPSGLSGVATLPRR